MSRLLQGWLAATVIGIAGLLVWAFAPILIALALIAAAMALVVVVAVAGARMLERRVGAGSRPADAAPSPREGDPEKL